MTSNATAGPRRTVHYGKTQITLLGTAHVSAASADEVRHALETGEYDACAVELCSPRHQRIMGTQVAADLDLFQVVREGKAGMVAANLALGAYQQRLADQFGIEPGAEMRAACQISEAAGYPVLLIDRDVGITLRRVYRSIPWWQRMMLIPGLFASLISSEKVTEAEIERLKEGDILENTFAEFATRSPALYHSLIDERDRFMAARIIEEAEEHGYKHILVVIGAGHLEGIAGYLEANELGDPKTVQAELEVVPTNRSLTRFIPWVVSAVIIAGFAIGFSRSSELGWELLVTWVVYNGGMAAVGAAIAFAHPLTILGSFLAAPLTSLNPTIGVGVVAAGIELYFRRPLVSDFARLRLDVAKLSGWWNNRVTRILLVFMLSSIGSAIATYVAGFRIWERLVG
jgi:pheromone shutdown-related protein TraB